MTVARPRIWSQMVSATAGANRMPLRYCPLASHKPFDRCRSQQGQTIGRARAQSRPLIANGPGPQRRHQLFRRAPQGLPRLFGDAGIKSGLFHRGADRQPVPARHGINAVAPDHRPGRRSASRRRRQQDHLAFHRRDGCDLLFQQAAPGARRQDKGVGVIKPKGRMGDGGAPVARRSIRTTASLVRSRPPAFCKAMASAGPSARLSTRASLGDHRPPATSPVTRGAISRTRPASISSSPGCLACRSSLARAGASSRQNQRAFGRIADILPAFRFKFFRKIWPQPIGIACKFNFHRSSNS